MLDLISKHLFSTSLTETAAFLFILDGFKPLTHAVFALCYQHPTSPSVGFILTEGETRKKKHSPRSDLQLPKVRSLPHKLDGGPAVAPVQGSGVGRGQGSLTHLHGGKGYCGRRWFQRTPEGVQAARSLFKDFLLRRTNRWEAIQWLNNASPRIIADSHGFASSAS